MCISPNQLPDGTKIGCRVCWQCRERKVDDWVGRCIAESRTAAATHSVTLTYGPDEAGNSDHLRAAVLTYSDCQLYFKRLRKDGFPLRYFAVGEYGSVKGRSHWHLLLFWQAGVPEHDLGQRFQEAHWPHGVSHWEKPSPASIRYVCKYLQKDIGAAERQGHLAMSKKPPLGDAWFRRVAEQHVDQGLAPQDLFYRFPEAKRPDGRPVEFLLAGKSAENYLAHFLKTWAERRGGFPPSSEVVEKYLDSQASSSAEIRPKVFPGRVAVPLAAPPLGGAPKFSERHHCYYSETPYGRLWWSENQQGELEWHQRIRPDRGVPLGDRVRRYQRSTDGA